MRTLVTGGAGFIGSHLTARLLELGHEVTILDDFSTGRRENLSEVESSIRCIEGSITDEETAAEAVAGVDWVFHQAAIPSVPRSMKDPLGTSYANVMGVLTVLKAAADANVGRFVFASSSSVYGNAPEFPRRETQTPTPESPYAVSKFAGEKYCQVFSQHFGLPTVALRYFNVFGPRQDPNSPYSAVIPKFIDLIMRDKSPVIFGDGEQTRDFTFVANVVHANICAAESVDVSGQVFNVACGAACSVNDLVQKLGALLNQSVTPTYAPPRAGDVRDSLASIDAAREALGYEPTTAFDEGLRRTVEWYRDRETVA